MYCKNRHEHYKADKNIYLQSKCSVDSYKLYYVI